MNFSSFSSSDNFKNLFIIHDYHKQDAVYESSMASTDFDYYANEDHYGYFNEYVVTKLKRINGVKNCAIYVNQGSFFLHFNDDHSYCDDYYDYDEDDEFNVSYVSDVYDVTGDHDDFKFAIFLEVDFDFHDHPQLILNH